MGWSWWLICSWKGEPLWSWSGICSPGVSNWDGAQQGVWHRLAGKAAQRDTESGTEGQRVWHSPGAGASPGTSHSAPHGTAALPWAWLGQNLPSSQWERRGRAPAGTRPGGQGRRLSRGARCSTERLLSEPSQGNNGLRVIFLLSAETPLRPCPRFSSGSDKAERDKSQIVLLCPTDWLHRA